MEFSKLTALFFINL
jgi:hypothetical protein